MNWEAIGAIGEVAGGLVVVFTLLYLAAQLRQSNRHAQAASQATFMDGWNHAIKGWFDGSHQVTRPSVIQKWHPQSLVK